MKALLTSRAEIEIFGKIYEKEDIIPVEYEKENDNISFEIKKTEFIYRLIKKSSVFAINIPKLDFEKEADICEMNEGEFTDKFKLTGFKRIECYTIDSPCIGKSTVYECSIEKDIKEDKNELVKITGKVIKTRET